MWHKLLVLKMFNLYMFRIPNSKLKSGPFDTPLLIIVFQCMKVQILNCVVGCDHTLRLIYVTWALPPHPPLMVMSYMVMPGAISATLNLFMLHFSDHDDTRACRVDHTLFVWCLLGTNHANVLNNI